MIINDEDVKKLQLGLINRLHELGGITKTKLTDNELDDVSQNLSWDRKNQEGGQNDDVIVSISNRQGSEKGLVQNLLNLINTQQYDLLFQCRIEGPHCQRKVPLERIIATGDRICLVCKSEMI